MAVYRGLGKECHQTCNFGVCLGLGSFKRFGLVAFRDTSVFPFLSYFFVEWSADWSYLSLFAFVPLASRRFFYCLYGSPGGGGGGRRRGWILAIVAVACR